MLLSSDPSLFWARIVQDRSFRRLSLELCWVAPDDATVHLFLLLANTRRLNNEKIAPRRGLFAVCLQNVKPSHRVEADCDLGVPEVGQARDRFCTAVFSLGMRLLLHDGGLHATDH
jgi:hypothetical protein